jgi:hypothetical protein
MDAQKARAYAYSLLVLESGKAKEWERALKLFSEEIAVDVPARCVLAAAVEDERMLAVIRDDAGALLGHYSEDRVLADVDVGALIPARLRDALSRCEEIQVLARPPLHGRPDLLPPELAWSYRSGRSRPGGSTGPRIVVTDIEPPPATGLLRLGAWSSGDRPDRVLAGAAATPSRALEEMADAGFIEIHAHGLVNLAVSDSSFLVLSPEADGRYALTAAEIRRRKLSGQPVVILGACHAARAASYHHQAWSLATAFIHAGARAVIASSAEIPDVDAGAFFDGLRARIARGQPPAVALRDGRREWMHSHPRADWVSGLMVFQ